MSTNNRPSLLASFDERPEEVVVCLFGEVATPTISDLCEALERATARNPRRLVVDLSKAERINLEGLVTIWSARERVGQLVLR